MHYYSSFFYAPVMPPFMLGLLPFLLLLIVWTLAIKGYALWHAARASDKGWFIALLILNTVGILELVYLFWFCKETSARVRSHSTHSEDAS